LPPTLLKRPMMLCGIGWRVQHLLRLNSGVKRWQKTFLMNLSRVKSSICEKNVATLIG
jgi:hypothetical protein